MGTLENKTQLAILKYLTAQGHYCWRNANVQRIIKGNYINNPYHKSGQGDITVILQNGYLEIECKTLTGRQSVVQAQHERRIKALGGHYLVARSVKDVQDYLSPVV